MAADEKAEDLLQPGMVLRNRWEVKKKLGGGGFGQIYVAADRKEKTDVALKAELRSANYEDVLTMEVAILNEMKGKAHFCTVYGCGQDPKFNFLVMELCGPSLSDLRKKSPHNSFSLPCSFMVTTQCITALKHLHQAGYLHRDIKPSNYAVGRPERNPRMIYILDFGLSRKYISESTKQIRKPREEVGFRGTVRYASITIHKGREMARVDDLWSVEMTSGKLPWRNETDKHKVLAQKLAIGNRQLIQRFPPSIMGIIDHLDGLDYLAEPNYNLINAMIKMGLAQAGWSEDEPFDWDNNWTNCQKPSTYFYNYQPPPENRREERPQPPPEQLQQGQGQPGPSGPISPPQVQPGQFFAMPRE